MSETRIEAVDPHDDEAVAAWHHVYATAECYESEDFATAWQLEEMRVMLQDAGSRVAFRAWSGLQDGRCVATGFLRVPLQSNLERAEMAVHVLPEERRRGLGSVMAAHLEHEVRALGRSVIGADVQWDAAGGSGGDGRPGPEFARAVGFELALREVQRELVLPVDDAMLSRMADEISPHHRGYSLRSFVGPVPDELVQEWATLSGSLMTEAPTGEMDLEPETVTVQQQRDAEEVIRKQGRTKYNTVALDVDGTLVAYTDLATTVHEPGRAYQWGTLVRRDHRGHRLGMAVKLANLRLLQQERSDIERLITWNAESNAHMVAVNEDLGFCPVAHFGGFQKRLTG